MLMNEKNSMNEILNIFICHLLIIFNYLIQLLILV